MIYIIRSGDYIKLGTTVNKFYKRLSIYKSHNPLIEVLDEFDFGTWEMERDIHANLRIDYEVVRKEWYRYSKDMHSLMRELIYSYKWKFYDGYIGT